MFAHCNMEWRAHIGFDPVVTNFRIQITRVDNLPTTFATKRTIPSSLRTSALEGATRGNVGVVSERS